MEKSLAQWIDQAAASPFTPALLEADPPLWGGFWQGDVIAPGYILPALELAVLRASRLDGNWPESTPLAQFLADLHAVICSLHAGVGALRLAGELCLIFAAETGAEGLVTVVWYSPATGCLHAGYRAPTAALRFEGIDILRPFPSPQPAAALTVPPPWLKQTVDHYAAHPRAESLSTRLDAAILRYRLAGWP
jgi:hypothetical protein